MKSNLRRGRLALGIICIALGFASSIHATASITKERIGTGSGFASSRVFTLNAATQITLDGRAIDGMTQAEFPAGLQGRATIGSDVNASITSGTASRIDFQYALKGPITTRTPLRILGQPVLTTADTKFVGIANIGALPSTGIVQVSGRRDNNNTLVATLLRLRSNGLPEWKLSGFLTAVNAAGGTANIGSQIFSTTGVSQVGCTTGLLVGGFVKVSATPIANFTAASVLNTATKIECDDPEQSGATDDGAVLTGTIAELPTATTIRVGQVVISFNPTTVQFVQGGLLTLDLGASIEVEGSYTAANAIAATKIKFIRPQIRFRRAITPGDLIAGQFVRFYNRDVYFTPQTRDQDGIAASGIGVSRDVEVTAFQDAAGALYAQKIRDRGPPNVADLIIAGPANTIVAPASFVIQGVTINASSSLFQDSNGTTISATQFFASLQADDVVNVEGSSYNAGTNTMIAAVIERVAPDDPTAPTPPAKSLSVLTSAKVSSELVRLDTDALMIDGME
jgi:hypothetical protein